ncbi:MFS transporter [Pluralibacter gergoviae]|uniref:MFS transporter n=1 Tax=Pluralibacter gergoviae TaxID=61647 RepID=A0AAI9GQT8_PLUGE|nr:MFS transporter [Pluralibacter gergoviae]EKV0917466.1 MFS transporter [Pluralibacter gergoviae]EKV9909615.1 MFS transporter [Pluralibacter gergoviae]EKW7275943.1 MFS transporter [Pluralibacter gergoviae]EKZ9515495.1 MFS transporter [Pluralibacter gergoviae]ELC3017545.1 MFS transporter [Pluralibacter gergoviae]
MTTLETNAAADKASGEGAVAPENAVRWSIPLSLLACVLLAFFDKISIAALFSDAHFQQAMGIDFDTTRLGILMSAFLLSYGFSSVLLSGLGDRIPPLRLLTGMMVAWCLLMVMMGFTHSYTLMIVLRILLGIAEGPLFPLAFAIVRQTFPQRMQARATMLWLLGTPFGAAVGFPLSLMLLSQFGWQSTFFTMALLTLPVLALVRIGLRGIRIESKTGMVENARQSRRAARRELLASPHFWLICIFNIAFLTYLWGINGWLPGYLINGKGIHLEHAGWMSSMPFIAMLLGEVLGAWLSDRLDKRAAACFISMAGAAVGLLAVMHLHTPLAVIAAMSFSTFMWGTGAPNIFALLAKATRARVSATAGGIFNGLGNFAGALSPAVMGALIAFTGSMDSGLFFLVVMAALGCALLLPLLTRY